MHNAQNPLRLLDQHIMETIRASFPKRFNGKQVQSEKAATYYMDLVRLSDGPLRYSD